MLGARRRLGRRPSVAAIIRIRCAREAMPRCAHLHGARSSEGEPSEILK